MWKLSKLSGVEKGQSVTCEGLFVPINLQVLFGYKNYDSTWLLVFIIDTVCKLCTPEYFKSFQRVLTMKT